MSGTDVVARVDNLLKDAHLQVRNVIVNRCLEDRLFTTHDAVEHTECAAVSHSSCTAGIRSQLLYLRSKLRFMPQ
jgi:hypothetical protein